MGTFTMLLSKGRLKWDYLDIYLTTFSEAVISEKENIWGSYFLSKYSKFNLNFKNAARNWEKKFFFRDNGIWTGIVKLSLSRTGYFSSPANVLTSSPKTLHVNKRDVFQLSWLGSDQRIMIKVIRWRFQQCLGTFTMLLVE